MAYTPHCLSLNFSFYFRIAEAVAAAVAIAVSASVLLQYSRWQLEKFIEPTCGRFEPTELLSRNYDAINIRAKFSRWKCCQSSGCSRMLHSTVRSQKWRLKWLTWHCCSPNPNPFHNWQPASRRHLPILYTLPPPLSPSLGKTIGCRTQNWR